MIKSEVSTKSKKAITYPILMRSTVSGVIVLFTTPSTGMAVKEGQYVSFGTYREDNWNDQSTPEHWEVFDGSITLTNE